MSKTPLDSPWPSIVKIKMRVGVLLLASFKLAAHSVSDSLEHATIPGSLYGLEGVWTYSFISCWQLCSLQPQGGFENILFLFSTRIQALLQGGSLSTHLAGSFLLDILYTSLSPLLLPATSTPSSTLGFVIPVFSWGHICFTNKQAQEECSLSLLMNRVCFRQELAVLRKSPALSL